MTKDEYENMRIENLKSTVRVDELKNQEDRTLIWGYTMDRDSVHVYIKGGILYAYAYDNNKSEMWYKYGEELDIQEAGIVPSKRLYPECCDKEFCELLYGKGESLPFTTFNSKRELKQFYGKVK